MDTYIDIDIDIEKLRVFPCLSFLSEEELYRIRACSKRQHFKKGDIVFTEGEPVRYFFIVEDGLVKTSKTSRKGKEIIVYLFEHGDYFCFPTHKVSPIYIVSATVLMDSTLIIIPIEEFEMMLNKAACATSYHIIQGLCDKISHLANMIEDITFRDVEQRVVKTIVSMANGCPSNKGIVQLCATHQYIAAMSGTVREVVARTMGKLKRKGIIVHSDINGFSVNIHRLMEMQIETRKYPFS